MTHEDYVAEVQSRIVAMARQMLEGKQSFNQGARVSVDNSLVHLAGALGQRRWGVLAAAPECRYPARGRHHALVRLFRQSASRSASAVMAAMSAALHPLFGPDVAAEAPRC